MQQLTNFLKKHKVIFYTIGVFILIIIHGRFDSFFKIDTLTLLLVLLLVVLPYIPLIKTWKFKYGDFEAEVTTDEINEIERKATKIPQNAEKTDNKNILDLKALAESDPLLAVAKLRIELEKQVKVLINIYLSDNAQLSRNFSLRFSVEILQQQGIIEKSLAAVLQDIIKVANRTIHGEEISSENALKLVDTYIAVSSELEFVIIQHALKSVKKENIEETDVDTFKNANYLLTTIVPLEDGALKNTYKVNQAELDAFLEGYNDYGEFIIELRKIDKKEP